jgi:DUF4097 and DUF4098 domain-containing protein YvlB
MNINQRNFVGGNIIINGKRVATGGNITIVNGTVIVDGKPVELDDSPVFNIVVEGNVEQVSGDFATITVNGDSGPVKTMSGDVAVQGDVMGDAKTMSGDVRVAGGITGKVSTMSGDIKR